MKNIQPHEKTERNAAIVAEARKGERSFDVIGKQYGITRQRVSQIIKQGEKK